MYPKEEPFLIWTFVERMRIVLLASFKLKATSSLDRNEWSLRSFDASQTERPLATLKFIERIEILPRNTFKLHVTSCLDQTLSKEVMQ